MSRVMNGRILNKEWKVYAQHALYRKNRRWYYHLTRFPGALFDENGYIVFQTMDAYERCSWLRHGVHLNIPEGIKKIPGYIRVGPGD